MIIEPEMSDRHRLQVKNLLDELGLSSCAPQLMLIAYQAVLTKELLWTNTELLQYKQQEFHRWPSES